MLSFDKNFLFIKQLLKNALKVDMLCLKPPYTSPVETDYGLRKIFWKSFEYNDPDAIDALAKTPSNQMICLNSKLGFSTIIYKVPEPFEECILCIGPFLAETLNNDFISKILHENDFPISVIQAIETYYRTLPQVDLLTILMTLQTLLAHFIPHISLDGIKKYNFSANKVKLVPEISNSQPFMNQFYDNYVSIHNAIFNQIGQSNYQEISQNVHAYLSQTGILDETNIVQLKYAIHKFNTKCEYAVLQKKIHYLYIERIFLQFEHKIQTETSRDHLLLLPYQMVHKYGLAVRNHSMEQYSHTVGSAINYIDLHLQEPLSLNYIADKLGKNASFLSSQFKKETGQTITAFIHEHRISYAIRLLNSTNLSIQEISEKVGILDLNYFCKLFKKQIGMTPTEYKKLIK